jgi:hypothetical protein
MGVGIDDWKIAWFGHGSSPCDHRNCKLQVRLYDFAQDIAWKLNDSQGKFTVSVWRFRRSSSHCANLGVAFFHPRFQARVEARRGEVVAGSGLSTVRE